MSSDSKSARKFWWILMLLPIGIAVGSVTSLVHHFRQNEETESQREFQVAVSLEPDEIQATMQRAQLFGPRHLNSPLGKQNTTAASRFLQGSVSPGGTGLQFSEINYRHPQYGIIKFASVDIPGSNNHELVTIVIELAGSNDKAATTQLGLTPALIRSLINEAPVSSIRFVFTPLTLSPAEHLSALNTAKVLSKSEDVRNLIVLKPQASVSLSAENNWTLSDSSSLASSATSRHIAITHPILHSEPLTDISPALTKATLNATEQLRQLILQLANQ